ncbi:MAG: AzlC family ABC transporter permease [Dehalococcoidia bacterium]
MAVGTFPRSAATPAGVSTLPLDTVRQAIADSIPVLIGITPFGIVIGAKVSDSPVNNLAGWAGSFLMYGGSAHLAVVSGLTAGAGIVAVLAAVIVNARLLLYSAALAPTFRHQPRWFRFVGPYFLTDQLFALTSARLAAGESDRGIRWYYLTIGIVMGLVWVPAIAIGVLLGPVLPTSWELGFAAPLMMVGLLAPALQNRPAWAAAAVGAVVAVLAASLPQGLGLLAGTAAGALAGVVVARWRGRSDV